MSALCSTRAADCRPIPPRPILDPPNSSGRLCPARFLHEELSPGESGRECPATRLFCGLSGAPGRGRIGAAVVGRRGADRVGVEPVQHHPDRLLIWCPVPAVSGSRGACSRPRSAWLTRLIHCPTAVNRSLSAAVNAQTAIARRSPEDPGGPRRGGKATLRGNQRMAGSLGPFPAVVTEGSQSP